MLREKTIALGSKKSFFKEMEFPLEHKWNPEYKILISHYTIQII